MRCLLMDIDDLAVFHPRDAVAKFVHAVVVRDHHHRPAGLECDAAEQFHDRVARLGVERRRRLVADQELRLVNEAFSERGCPLSRDDLSSLISRIRRQEAL